MVKISIIIPVYNTEEYIEKCLNSIFQQNYIDLEVICINDGSTDKSLEILLKYQKQYKNLKVINKSNEGSGIARNLGLKVATGEYILFADSDDWYLKNAFYELFEIINKKNKTDIIIFGALTFDQKKTRKGHYSINKIPSKFYNSTFSYEDIKEDLFKFPSTAWSKIYRRNFLEEKNIKFQEIIVGQDQLFFINSMILAKDIKTLNKNIYCYNKNRKGSTTSIKKKKSLSAIYVFYAIENLIKDNKLNNSYFILDKYFKKALSWLPKMADDYKDIYYDELIQLLDHVSIHYPNRWWSKLSINKKDSYLIIKLKISILNLFFKLKMVISFLN